MNIKDKVVIVTGAARGIGLEYCKALLEAGARVVATDVSSCEAALAFAPGQPDRIIEATVDVTSMASVQAMVAEVKEKFGRIDALINNAALYGALRGGRFDTISEQDWDAAMTVNVKGIWNCCKAVAPIMREQRSGSIVNITSLAATYGTPYVLHYTTSKAAVIGLTRGLARELGRDNIRVNAVAPSAVMTEGTREFFADKAQKALDVVKSGQSIQRNLVAADLAGSVLWLVSDASEFVTGQTISVDGGTVMN